MQKLLKILLHVHDLRRVFRQSSTLKQFASSNIFCPVLKSLIFIFIAQNAYSQPMSNKDFINLQKMNEIQKEVEDSDIELFIKYFTIEIINEDRLHHENVFTTMNGCDANEEVTFPCTKSS